MKTLDEVIEIGRGRIVRLREKYRQKHIENGLVQLAVLPEEIEILLATDCPDEFKDYVPRKIEPPTVVHVTAAQFERMLNLHVRPNAPQSRIKRRTKAAAQAADIRG